MQHNQIEIVLIEDNPDEADLAIRSLKKHNLANNLIHIDDGAEALDFVLSKGKYEGTGFLQNPKLILLDLKLPKVNGLEILKQIKSGEKTKTIPVVVLTSSKEEKDIIESYNLGVNSYIVKPIDFNSFTNAVGEVGLYWLVTNQPPNLK